MEELKLIILNYEKLFEYYESNNKHGSKSTPMIDSNNISFKKLTIKNPKSSNIKENIKSNKELFKLQLENKNLVKEVEEIKKRNKTLEIRQKEIVAKMKNLRSIQIDSDLHQRWNDEINDLEIIVEDAELFLDSVVNTHKNTNKLFFGDSKIKPKKEEILNDKNMEIVLEPLFTKLQEMDLSGFDNEEMELIDQKIANLYNPIECILVFVNSFEKSVIAYKKKNKYLLKEQGKVHDKTNK